MTKFLWWAGGIIFVTVLVAGVGTAYAITHTITSTTGTTGGLIVGGVPDFVKGFQKGFNAGSGGGKQHPGTSWSGPSGTGTWKGLQTAPAKKAHPHHAPKHHHPKPNV